jgi:hypothetical protein
MNIRSQFFITFSVFCFNFFLSCNCDEDWHTVCIQSWYEESCCNDFCITYQPDIIHFRRWSTGSPPSHLNVRNWLPGIDYCYQTYKREGEIQITLFKYCCDGRLYCVHYSDKIPKPKAECNDNETKIIKIPLKCQHINGVECSY